MWLEATCSDISEETWNRYMKGARKLNYNWLVNKIKKELPDLYYGLRLDLWNPYSGQTYVTKTHYVLTSSSVEYFINKGDSDMISEMVRLAINRKLNEIADPNPNDGTGHVPPTDNDYTMNTTSNDSNHFEEDEYQKTLNRKRLERRADKEIDAEEREAERAAQNTPEAIADREQEEENRRMEDWLKRNFITGKYLPSSSISQDRITPQEGDDEYTRKQKEKRKARLSRLDSIVQNPKNRDKKLDKSGFSGLKYSGKHETSDEQYKRNVNDFFKQNPRIKSDFDDFLKRQRY